MTTGPSRTACGGALALVFAALVAGCGGGDGGGRSDDSATRQPASSAQTYVADTDNHTVRYIDAQRRVRTVLGTPGRRGHRFDSLPGELSLPSSLALVPGGLVVATGQGLVRAGF